MIGNGAGPERGTFLKMFDKNFLLSERTSSYFEFIKELTENIKLIRGYMEKYSNNETSGGKRDKLSDKDNSLDPVFLKKGNTVYNRRLGRTFLMTDGKGGGTSTNLPAKDTFPAKKIPPDYIYPRN